jgi:hypothetical protein
MENNIQPHRSGLFASVSPKEYKQIVMLISSSARENESQTKIRYQFGAFPTTQRIGNSHVTGAIYTFKKNGSCSTIQSNKLL